MRLAARQNKNQKRTYQLEISAWNGESSMHPISGPGADAHVQPARLDCGCNETPMLRKGMVVTLNTGDVAVVESLAADAPDKPIVVILRDRTGRAVKPRIVIDLRSQPDVYLVAVAPAAPAK